MRINKIINGMKLFNLNHTSNYLERTEKTLIMIYVEKLYAYVYIYITDIVDIQSCLSYNPSRENKKRKTKQNKTMTTRSYLYGEM